MSLTMLPGRMSYLEDEEGGGDPLDDSPVLPEMMSYLEAKERGENTLDEPHSASWEDVLPGGQGERRKYSCPTWRPRRGEEILLLSLNLASSFLDLILPVLN